MRVYIEFDPAMERRDLLVFVFETFRPGDFAVVPVPGIIETLLGVGWAFGTTDARRRCSPPLLFNPMLSRSCLFVPEDPRIV
jgi:hypothetical protein